MDARTLCSSSPSSACAPWRSRRRAQGHCQHRHIAARALFDPPPFRAEKLTVTYTDNTSGLCGQGPPGAPGSRRYTLTHNDLTGALQLTVGPEYNLEQISGFYTRLLRDEVVAEWHFSPSLPSLHIYCHVSGEERWLAPPRLRNYIFRRELPLVLDTILYADRQLLQQHPELNNAEVYVHFQSSQQDLDGVELWGILGQRASWQSVPTSILKRMLMTLIGQEAQLQQQAYSVNNTQPGSIARPSTPHTPVPLPSSMYLSVAPVVAALDVLDAPYTSSSTSSGNGSSNGSSNGNVNGSSSSGTNQQGAALQGLTLLEPLSPSGQEQVDSSSTGLVAPPGMTEQQPAVAVVAEAGGSQSCTPGVVEGGRTRASTEVVVCTSLHSDSLPFSLGPLSEDVEQQQQPAHLRAHRQRFQGMLTRSGARL